MAEDELYHYGVKGMKWGKRKQQYYVNSNNRKAKKYDRYANERSKSPLRSEKAYASMDRARADEYRKRATDVKNVNLNSKKAGYKLKAANGGYSRATKEEIRFEKTQKALKVATGAAVVAAVGMTTYAAIIAHKDYIANGRKFAEQAVKK